MQHYKNHPISGFAVRGPGRLWRFAGLVFDRYRPAREIKRLECADVVYTSRHEAEEHALTLCRAWIDGLSLENNKHGTGKQEPRRNRPTPGHAREVA